MLCRKYTSKANPIDLLNHFQRPENETCVNIWIVKWKRQEYGLKKKKPSASAGAMVVVRNRPKLNNFIDKGNVFILSNYTGWIF